MAVFNVKNHNYIGLPEGELIIPKYQKPTWQHVVYGLTAAEMPHQPEVFKIEALDAALAYRDGEKLIPFCVNANGFYYSIKEAKND